MSRGSSGKVIAGLGLGIALGTAFGFYALAPNVEGGPAGSNYQTENQLQAERHARQAAEGNNAVSDAVLSEVSGDIVKNELKSLSVVIFTTPDANADFVRDIQSLIKAAGGNLSGTVQLTEKVLNTDSGDQVKSLAANSLPTGVKLDEENRTPGMHAGQLIGGALHTGDKEVADSDRAVALGALENADLLAYQGKPPAAADLALIVSGSEDNDYATSFLADFAKGLDSKMAGVVVAGDYESAEQNGAVAKIRDNHDAAGNLSTVDNVDTEAGRITVIRALREQKDDRAGHYGSASNATKETVE
ncbi:copper transporter [Corynebacterium anserum]|uniref:Copper transporter n=1 Tax=Corynebacterium anserum TaxID=2684406 RepID=A0A7G7YN81_9CORY|nr:copper transporter [Corynebacterium anserum]MBC2681493.1 copper transporter [Corynebacterium anserum]QNH95951.1 copper transporter [Corynebacterium anserum]